MLFPSALNVGSPQRQIEHARAEEAAAAIRSAKQEAVEIHRRKDTMTSCVRKLLEPGAEIASRSGEAESMAAARTTAARGSLPGKTLRTRAAGEGRNPAPAPREHFGATAARSLPDTG